MNIKSTYLILFLFLNFQLISCQQHKKPTATNVKKTSKEIKTGAENTSLYLPMLKGKRVAVVANLTSVIRKKEKETKKYTHLVDSLLSLSVNVLKVFAPEHGFRGKADAGEHVNDGKDSKTGLPIFSLHGKNRKPSKEQLKDIDIVVFDIQDVGVRFYTYIATLQYVMSACAEAGVSVMVLDRPNPNGHYVDGPTLEVAHRSFLGLNPIPLVYGMTIGEYAQMINGEGWLKKSIKCNVTVIPLQNYNHNTSYSLSIRPSPNLPNDKAINLYPSLGFFEGTTINAGRGTEMQFQIYGAPFFNKVAFSYTPQPNFGSKYPKHKGNLCYGVDLRNEKKLSKVDIQWIIDAYNKTPKKEKFFGATFTVHAGNETLQKQIIQGLSAKEIRKTWEKDLMAFKKIRAKYLMYE